MARRKNTPPDDPNRQFDSDGRCVAVRVVGKDGEPAWVTPNVARGREVWPEGKRPRQRGFAPRSSVVKDDSSEVAEDALESKEIGRKPEEESTE